jgi:pentatricopeptide repeat protein
LAALSIFIFYFLGKEIYDQKTGLLASLLGSVSIWFLLMSSTIMSHTASLFFTALFLLFFFRSLRSASFQNGALAGASWGMAFLIRPYNAILFTAPFLIYYAFFLFKNIKSRLKNAFAFAVFALIFMAILLTYNQLTNGHPLRMGYVVSYGKEVLPGFGRAAVSEFILTPLRGAENIGEYLKAINTDLFGWPFSSFLALLPLLWLRRMNPDFRKKHLLLATGFIFLLLGLFFYWGTSTLIIGARLIFESTPVLILLSARGITELPSLLTGIFRKLPPRKMEKGIAGVLILFFAYAFFIRFPRWVMPRDTGDPLKTIGHNFAGTTPAIHNSLKSLGLRQSAVILKLFSPPLRYFPTGGWGSGFLYNDPELQGNIIYARDRAAGNSELFSCFPQRNFYLYLGTLEKGMLVPLVENEGKVIYGKPMKMNGGIRKGVELVDQPRHLFKLYSKEFEEFVDRLFEENNFTDVDADRLRQLGIFYQKINKFKEAAFCFEAALQVENNPEIRLTLFNLLTSSYFKAGKTEEAKQIIDFMKKVNFNKEKFYSVFPERGF